MALDFEWDHAKAQQNIAKHGVGFDEAATSFGDPLSITVPDPAHSEVEDRFIHLGVSYRNRLVVTVFTERGAPMRIISARLATSSERSQYEQRITDAE